MIELNHYIKMLEIQFCSGIIKGKPRNGNISESMKETKKKMTRKRM